MPELTVTNWFGNIVSHPQVVVEANSTEQIIAILKDPVKYPSPVRAVGSNHSTAPCGAADGGTLIKMANMNKIVSITDQTVTAQAGAILHRYRARTREAPVAVLRQHGDWQSFRGQRSLRRNQRRAPSSGSMARWARILPKSR